MSATTRVGTAVAAGYVLGRFKKMRMALIVGSALANRNVRAAGMDLIRGPDGGGERSPLVEAGRTALIGAAASRMNRISDRLHERSTALSGSEDDNRSDEAEDEYDDEDLEDDEDVEEEPEDDEDVDEEAEDDEDDEAEEAEEERKPRKSSSSRSRRKS